MAAFDCSLVKRLSPEEKQALGPNLLRHGLAENIFLVYENLAERLSGELELVCVKVLDEGGAIAGAAFFIRVQPVDMLASIAALRENAFVRWVSSPFVSRSRACAYLCMRSVSMANLMAPWFVCEDALLPGVTAAILSYLKAGLRADLLMVMDTPQRKNLYFEQGFQGYPCPSEAVLDLAGYRDLGDYLAGHRSTRKHIVPRQNVAVSIQNGALTAEDIDGLRECVRDSARHARSELPYGDLFYQRLLESDLFRLGEILHVLVRVDSTIAGFHSYLPCGLALGAIAGGFNRAVAGNNYVYERLIAATVDYALRHGMKRIHYGIVDNRTKLRLTNALEPNLAYYYLANPAERWMMRLVNRYTDLSQLFVLEQDHYRLLHNKLNYLGRNYE